MKSYVLIQAETHSKPLAQRLLAIPGVISAEDISGAYDAIALAMAASTCHLVERVVAEIRNLPGVTRALPAPLIRSVSDDPHGEPAAEHEAA